MHSRRTTTLVNAAADGDQHAWDAIVPQFLRLAWATVRSYRLDDAAAADVVQKRAGCGWSRTSASSASPSGSVDGSPTTARRECLRSLRSARRSIPVDDDAVFDRA